VYYDGYLASLNGEQEGESEEEQYKNLIQSQNGDQGEESMADQYKELLPIQESDPNADTVKLPVRSVDDQIANITDELGL
jgi:hypothetical protein